MESIEQHHRRRNVEIRGVPETHGENIRDIICKIGETVRINITRDDIATTRRTGMRRSDSKPRPIIVSFNSLDFKINCIKAIKEHNKKCTTHSKKLNSTDIGFSGSSQPIYVSDDLTQKNRYYLMKAKAVARENNVKYVWVSAGRVFMKKNDGQKPVIVNSDSCLLKFANFDKTEKNVSLKGNDNGSFLCSS